MVSQWLNWISDFGFWAINSGFFRENHEFFNPFIHGSQIALEVKEKKKKKKKTECPACICYFSWVIVFRKC